MTAPPKTPVIINPDISFALSGRDWIAMEKMIEKTFAMENPIMAKSAKTAILSVTKISAIKARTATNAIYLKNFTEEYFARRIAPIKAPAVRNAKYMLGP